MILAYTEKKNPTKAIFVRSAHVIMTVVVLACYSSYLESHHERSRKQPGRFFLARTDHMYSKCSPFLNRWFPPFKSPSLAVPAVRALLGVNGSIIPGTERRHGGTAHVAAPRPEPETRKRRVCQGTSSRVTRNQRASSLLALWHASKTLLRSAERQHAIRLIYGVVL